MSVKFEVPDWRYCDETVHYGCPTPLESFVYENEPSGKEAAVDFRKQLQAVLDFVTGGDDAQGQ